VAGAQGAREPPRGRHRRAHSRLHTFRIERLSEDLPIVVEIVDTREKLEAFLALVDGAIAEGLATLEKAHVHFYRPGRAPEELP
jgi:PII-like signaling protein